MLSNNHKGVFATILLLALMFTVSTASAQMAGVTVTPTELSVHEGTSEIFTVVLDTPVQTDKNVLIEVYLGNGAEGYRNISLSYPIDPTTIFLGVTFNGLTFKEANWDVPQTVTVSFMGDAFMGDLLFKANLNVANLQGQDTRYDLHPNGVIPVDDVTIRFIDDDSPSVLISETELTVPEGSPIEYTIALGLEPTGDVTIVPSSSGPVTFFPTELTFRAADFSTPQAITVLGDHDLDAVDGAGIITHSVSGANYNDVTAADVAFTVEDDENPFVSFTRTLDMGATIVNIFGDGSGTFLTIDEGGAGTYEVALTVRPTGGDVTIRPVINNIELGDIRFSPAELIFTSRNFGTPQKITVTSRQDNDAVNDMTDIIHTLETTSDYDGVAATTVEVTVTDDETAGVAVSTTTLTIAEGGTSTYEIVLTSAPSFGSVTITLSKNMRESPDINFDPDSLTFDLNNYNVPQTITVRGAEDNDEDNDMITIMHYVAPSEMDSDYDGVTAESVAVTMTDNDIRAVTVTPTTLTIDEGGASGTYTVFLSVAPIGGEVTITPSSDNTDIAFAPATLTFTTVDFDRAQTIMVSGMQDLDAVNDTGTISHAVTGANYNGVTAEPVAVTVTDPDTARVTVSETMLTIAEGGASVTYTVVLDTEPTGTVTITLSSDNTDIAFAPATLTFTTATYNITQTVTVSGGEDDDATTDTATISHAVEGADYNGVAAESVTVTVTDDDTAGVTVTPTELTITEGAGGSYTIVLDTEPSGTVTITPSSNNDDITFSPATLTFTATSFGTQTVTVSGAEDDDSADAMGIISHAVAGADYNGVTAESVTVTVTDDDSPAVTVSDATLTITENGSGTYTIVLDTEPSGTVTITPISNNGDITFSPLTLTFTTDTFSIAQTVTVSGGDDADAVNDMGTITHTATGADYDGIDTENATVAVTVTDNDTRGVTVSTATLTIDEGGNGTYTITLTSAPSGGDVTITPVSDNTDITFEPTSLTFTTATFSVAQMFTVSGAQDPDAVNDMGTITHTVFAPGTDYDDFSAEDVAVMVTDNDTAGVTVSTRTLTIDEGGTGTYTVVLDTAPNGVVTIDSRSTGDTDITVTPMRLTFTAADYNITQTFTVSATEDDDAADDRGIIINIVNGADYAVLGAGAVTVMVTDNDMRAVTVSKSTLTINEEGTGEYTIALDTKPSGEVTITPTSTNTEIGFLPASVTFTTATYNIARTITVSGVADDDAEDDSGTISHTVVGADYAMAMVTAEDVAVTVTDNDRPGISVSKTTLSIAEGGSGSYTIVLNTEPRDEVTITPMSNNGDITFAPASLTFTVTNFSNTQTITVSGARDDDITNDMGTIRHGVTAAVDYASLSADPVMVTVTDSTPEFIGSGMATVIENTDITTVVYNAQAIAVRGGVPDTGINYVLRGSDTSAFTIDADDGEVRLNDPANFEAKASYALTVIAAAGTRGSATLPVTVTVTDADDPTTFMQQPDGALNDGMRQFLPNLSSNTLTLSVIDYFRDEDVPDPADLIYGASSADTAVVTVSITQRGILTYAPVVAIGSSVITVTAHEGINTGTGKVATRMFTVTLTDGAAATSTQIDAQELSVAGGVETLDVTGNFADPNVADSADLIYDATSATEGVATVDISATGLLTITPVMDGTSVITVTAKQATDTAANKTTSQTFTVTVGDRATMAVVQIADQTLTLAGGTQSLTVTSNFADADVADSADLTYGASSATRATVTVSITDAGVLIITPVAVGSSVITVTAQEGTNTPATQTFTVTVTIFDLDVDANGEATVLDGIMIIRYIAGTKEGEALTAGLSVVDDPAIVAAKIERGIASGVLDVDESGQATVLDGLMIIRYIGGTNEGEALTAGLSDVDDPAPVAENIKRLILIPPLP